ncbi:hypothetical protein ACFRKB_00040 [Streptomyces scopuliridis]|uniref:hypothetical protein n=1 Tax=Streptomyces scopuliridis TaxID=452529 RepID=UPI00368E65C0
MGEGVSVCCPSCGSRHTVTASVYPCVCGAPVAPTLAGGGRVETVTRRAWADEWVTVRCTACAREDQWPRPELGCPCGAMLRIAVEQATSEPVASEPVTSDPVAPGAAAPDTATAATDTAGRPAPGLPAPIPPPPAAPSPRPGFRPVTIRTAQDAVTTAALYLRWLGFKSVVESGGSGEPSAPGISTRRTGVPGTGLRGPDVVAQVDPTTDPASLRSVECLWLNGMNASATSVYFSLAGYTDDARARADDLGLPLFVLDLTGAPQPVNGPADELVSSGA